MKILNRIGGTALLLAGTVAYAQSEGPVATAFGPNARMIRGTVTASMPDHVTVKTEAGEIYDVVVTPNTQVRKGRDLMKIADVHAGDGVGAMGEIDPARKTVHALMLMVVSAEDLKKAREAMGKTVISGTVTAIGDLKLTIKRTDDVVQVIQVDEDTSFRKGGRGMQQALGADGLAGLGGGGRRAGASGAAAGTAAVATPSDAGESLTLADVKVGSVVAGQGVLKNGIFVPTTLAISEPGAARQGQGRRRPDSTSPSAATPPAAKVTPPTATTEPK